MMEDDECYWVEEGMMSVRDSTMVWRFWSTHGEIEEAKKEAKRLAYGRVLYVKLVAAYKGGKQS